jgi:DNA-binding LacI/PurR family transcriptional regulator
LTCQFGRPKGPAFDETELVGILAGRDAPTAVVGLRDVDAWCVREDLRENWPEALERLTFVGDGDTPWSQTSHPPFTTLNWNLDRIADLAAGIIRAVQAGKTFKKPVAHLIPPRLVAR